MIRRSGLSEHIVAQATPREMDAQWAAIEARLSRRRVRWFAISLALAGATALALLIQRDDATQWTSQDSLVPVALDDGSQLALQPHSQVSLLERQPGKLELQIARGGARFQVTRDPQRRFQVVAADIQVTVTGTVFTVSVQGAKPRVSVEQGEVEVRRLRQTALLARLHAGESWPAPPAPPAAPVQAPPPAASAPTLAPEQPATPKPEAAPGSARPTAVARVPVDPRRLLEQANAARRSGEVAQAAALLEELGQRFPRDGRAGLASFELGRLRMEALGDVPGALAAIRKSITLDPNGVFREDADACLATAYSRLRDRPRCESARRAYLDRYPTGVHAAAMSALDCGRSP